MISLKLADMMIMHFARIGYVLELALVISSAGFLTQKVTINYITLL